MRLRTARLRARVRGARPARAKLRPVGWYESTRTPREPHCSSGARSAVGRPPVLVHAPSVRNHRRTVARSSACGPRGKASVSDLVVLGRAGPAGERRLRRRRRHANVRRREMGTRSARHGTSTRVENYLGSRPESRHGLRARSAQGAPLDAAAVELPPRRSRSQTGPTECGSTSTDGQTSSPVLVMAREPAGASCRTRASTASAARGLHAAMAPT